MAHTFTPADLAQITSHGLSAAAVDRQIEDFVKGFPFLDIKGAATVGDGIVRLAEGQAEALAAKYDKLAAGLETVKFVPASGAATRMFKDLFEFLSDDKTGKVVEQTLAGIEKFAFKLPASTDPKQIVASIIKTPGLGYGSQPKALIQFHNYPEGARTAAEEHLAEGAMYAAPGGVVKIHFTVSAEHLDGFKTLFAEKLPLFEKRFGVKYDISFSQQKPSTDTIAVNPDNTPFRNPDGTLLFRPAGHGALLANLNEIDADVVFVKNIDNVAPDRLKEQTVLYKKALAGLLLELQAEAFERLSKLDGADLADTARFIREKLCYRLPEGAGREYMRAVLERPMRVCGMVRNEGEPGGGPFWVANPDGSASLQIAESSQIAPTDMHIMREATHFNPVDLVCAPRDAKGRHYDLLQFKDPSTGFISEKSKDGKALRAQELPGLWNGAMAKWTTVFVEVPIATFSPVKTVADLLRDEHQ